MAQSIQHLEQEIAALKEVIKSTENEIHEINTAIKEAENHILDDDKVNFWEPKLASLRQDKVFLLKREEKLQEEALVLEKSRLASLNIEARSSEFGFFDMEGNDDDNESPDKRGRNTTWAGDHISLLYDKSQKQGDNMVQGDDVKKVESSPSIMTKVEEDAILNHDPDAKFQGQNRRPHMGNLKSKTMEREDSFNVFGVGIEEDDVSVNNSTLPLPKKITRDVSDMSLSSETSDEQADKQFSVGKFLNEFFVASENLLLAQGNNPGTPGSSRTNSLDRSGPGGTGATTASVAQETLRGQLQPAVSTHDFSVFGAEMYNDNDDDER